MKTDIRMLPGAPPDDQLVMRLRVCHTYQPDLDNYQGDDPEGFINGTKLGYLRWDKDCVDSANYGIDEALGLWGPNQDGVEVVWELVDEAGIVWTETFEVPDAPESKTDA